MTGLVLALTLLANAEPLKLASPELQGRARRDQITYYSAFFANQLRAQGVKVTPESEADAVVRGTLTRFSDDGMELELKAIAPDGELLARRAVTAQNPDELTELLRRAAQELAAELFHRFERVPVHQEPEELPPDPARLGSTTPGLAAAGLGALFGAGGAALLVYSWVLVGQVRGAQPATYPAARSELDAAKIMSIGGMVMLAVGGVAAVAGLGYAFTVSRTNARLMVVPAPRGAGAMLGLEGTLP